MHKANDDALLERFFDGQKKMLIRHLSGRGNDGKVPNWGGLLFPNSVIRFVYC